jgi:hypothetical protein
VVKVEIIMTRRRSLFAKFILVVGSGLLVLGYFNAENIPEHAHAECLQQVKMAKSESSDDWQFFLRIWGPAPYETNAQCLMLQNAYIGGAGLVLLALGAYKIRCRPPSMFQ